MRFFNRRPQPPDRFVVSVKEVLNKFIMDCDLEEAQQVATILGLPPLSDEEREASAERVAEASTLRPIIDTFATLLTAGSIEYCMTVSDDLEYEIDGDTAVFLAMLVRRISIATAFGTICQLEDLGLIHYGGHK